MSQNYSLHFFLKKPKNYKGGEKAIYMRITVAGDTPKEASCGRMCDPKGWLSSANRAKGNTEVVKSLNGYLDAIARKVQDIHTEFIKYNQEVTAETLMNKYQNKDDKKLFLLEIFKDHNEKMKALIGKGFKANTLKGYHTSLLHLSAYMLKSYQRPDIEVKKLDYAFITGYDFYLRTDPKCSGVSIAKYMKHLRKIVNSCIAHKWITENPFLFYKNTAKAKDSEFLSKDELKSITEKSYRVKRLEQVRDIFLFCCYTGLSYADVKKLKRSEIRKGDDGRHWIFTSREKTLTSSHVPLMTGAQALLDKYTDDPVSENLDMAFPVLSNQKMNSYLKEIADLSGIQKELTFHIARHTFATTVTLSNDVPIESVSKMLGHKDLKTTQHYSKILNTKIARDMSMLDQKLMAV
ncbi:Site-specific recombinase XerD [Sphingobacterium nematocida]|uniref:Site-specific recombinase XerD n=1 Tax=Sphingobacterium nematocida TaxID=1513896 RepID=A0A1T5FIM5_9SPHI|nr:site-specific integrase [Sphingobacterium nematocida]SKB96021.1 Site-specific recombinase XerD [Sphingobacterium nematocida]